eukprot:gene58150-biopygen41024
MGGYPSVGDRLRNCCSALVHSGERVKCHAGGSCFGKDLDVLFAYTTTKQVKILDARLGLLNIGLMVGIVFYIVVVTVMWKGKYLQKEVPMGVVRFSVQQPTVDACDPDNVTCYDSIAPMQSIPYCGQPHACIQLDYIDAVQKHENSLFLTTRVDLTKEMRNTSCHQVTCKKVYIPHGQGLEIFK